ncbi:MAG: hypothetical protein H0X51_03295 [Parachlamydiaceae bacterium]|nr:hypothetical protein [Parachlamydiaceae bacterium]
MNPTAICFRRTAFTTLASFSKSSGRQAISVALKTLTTPKEQTQRVLARSVHSKAPKQFAQVATAASAALPCAPKAKEDSLSLADVVQIYQSTASQVTEVNFINEIANLKVYKFSITPSTPIATIIFQLQHLLSHPSNTLQYYSHVRQRALLHVASLEILSQLSQDELNVLTAFFAEHKDPRNKTHLHQLLVKIDKSKNYDEFFSKLPPAIAAKVIIALPTLIFKNSDCGIDILVKSLLAYPKEIPPYVSLWWQLPKDVVVEIIQGMLSLTPSARAIPAIPLIGDLLALVPNTDTRREYLKQQLQLLVSAEKILVLA